MSNSHKYMGVNGEALQLHAVYKKLCENQYQVLQVMCVCVNEINALYDK